MRLAVLAAVVVIVWAAILSIRHSVQPLNATQLAASTVLALGVAIQRINGVQKWLTAPREDRKTQVDTLAQQTLIRLCRDKTVTDELKDLRIHVWEVPRWYRRLFPYRMRRFIKGQVSRGRFRVLSKRTVHPTLHRMSAVGLVKKSPSGVVFRKGVGLVGLCIANNDGAELLTLDTDDRQYKAALEAKTDRAWLKLPPWVTHNLKRPDAKRLANSYHQVIAKVVQDPGTGEAIGCVTMSIREELSPGFKLAKDQTAIEGITDLALAVAPLLS